MEAPSSQRKRPFPVFSALSAPLRESMETMQTRPNRRMWACGHPWVGRGVPTAPSWRCDRDRGVRETVRVPMARTSLGALASCRRGGRLVTIPRRQDASAPGRLPTCRAWERGEPQACPSGLPILEAGDTGGLEACPTSFSRSFNLLPGNRMFGAILGLRKTANMLKKVLRC